MIRSLLAALLLVSGLAHADDPKILKIATLAPEGSSWMKLFHEWGNNIEKRTGGRVKLKFYAGGIKGDERDAVRRMRGGEINGAAVTAVGLGLIQPEVRVLEVPFLFRGYEELDHVRNKLDAEFKKKFEERGYVLLSWGDVGPVHLFSNTPVKSRADLTQMKLWAWTDDPIIRTLFEVLGLNGVPLGVPAVLPSLHTGLINACYGSPLSTVALQWHSKVKYMTQMVLSQSVGAAVVTKKAWDEFPADVQAVVMEESKALQAKLLKSVRDDNVVSEKKMISQGVQVVPTPPALEAEFQKEAKAVAKKLEGQLYSTAFRSQVEKLVAEYRQGHK